MKSPIILQNRGFLIVEVMISFSLLTLFLISTFTLSSTSDSMKYYSLNRLEDLKKWVMRTDKLLKSNFSNSEGFEIKKLGNETLVYDSRFFKINNSNYEKAKGRNNCDPRIDFNKDEYEYLSSGIDVGNGNPSTDIEVRNGYVYLTTDSSTLSKPDLFIVDSRNKKILSSLNTGPGLKALEIAGPFIYLAQASTQNQLQIIDIHDRTNPNLITQFKLPLPTPTTTAPFATTIFYSKEFIYLGTEKWNGSEFYIIDVSDVYSPFVVGSFETNTLINDIYVVDDKAYLATADQKQLRILDISDKAHPTLIDYFSPTGWQTQEGKVINFFEDVLSLGRTVGGFNVVGNHEIFKFGTSSNLLVSKDIPGGVYSVVSSDKYNFLITHNPNEEFQIFDMEYGKKISSQNLSSNPVKMSCDLKDFYFATGESEGYSILKKK